MSEETIGQHSASFLHAVLSLLAFALTGCAGSGWSPEWLAGSGSSAVAEVAAEQLYQGLELDDLVLARENIQISLESAPSQEKRYWVGNPSGAYGYVMPLRTFRITSGHYCREFQETVATDDGIVSATKIACRDDDKIWKEAELKT